MGYDRTKSQGGAAQLFRMQHCAKVCSANTATHNCTGVNCSITENFLEVLFCMFITSLTFTDLYYRSVFAVET